MSRLDGGGPADVLPRRRSASPWGRRPRGAEELGGTGAPARGGDPAGCDALWWPWGRKSPPWSLEEAGGEGASQSSRCPLTSAAHFPLQVPLPET